MTGPLKIYIATGTIAGDTETGTYYISLTRRMAIGEDATEAAKFLFLQEVGNYGLTNPRWLVIILPAR